MTKASRQLQPNIRGMTHGFGRRVVIVPDLPGTDADAAAQLPQQKYSRASLPRRSVHFFRCSASPV